LLSERSLMKTDWMIRSSRTDLFADLRLDVDSGLKRKRIYFSRTIPMSADQGTGLAGASVMHC
jgi:hypothetical protein